MAENKEKTVYVPNEPVLAERSLAATVVANLAATGTIAKLIVDARKPK
jgi:hypothetical protein